MDAKSYCNWENTYTINDLAPTPLNLDPIFPNGIMPLVVNEGKYRAVYSSTFLGKGENFATPKLNVSSFEGCSHFYGRIYWKETIYEVQQEITEEYLKQGKEEIGGDYEGYTVGDYTQRFLTKGSLIDAFEILKKKMIG